MFETEKLNSNSGAAWLGQLFLAIQFPLLYMWILGTLVNHIRRVLALPTWNVEGILLLSAWVIDLPLTLLIQKFFPSSAVTGKLVWIVPVPIYCLISTISAFGGFQRTLSAAFGEGALFTLPTFASVMYSLGMMFERRKSARLGPAANQDFACAASPSAETQLLLDRFHPVVHDGAVPGSIH